MDKQMERQYNPYSAECIKHFEGISRVEIDRLMTKMKKDKEIQLKKALQRQAERAPNTLLDKALKSITDTTKEIGG